ncbi:MAG: prolyl oligopeptidase family serine peptidase [Bryobacteraceae bacterium]
MVQKQFALFSLFLLVFSPVSAVRAQTATARAASPAKFALTIDSIMRGAALTGYEPSAARFSGDGQKIYFSWKQYSDKRDAPMDTYVVNRDGSGSRKLSDEEAKLATPSLEGGGGGRFGGFGAGGDLSKDRRYTTYANQGDIFIWDHQTDTRRQVTKTTEAESNPRFLPDGKRISFSRGGQLYILSLDGGMIEQITDIRAAATGAPVAGPAAGAARGQGGGGRQGGGPPTTGGERGEQKGTDSQEFLKKEERDLLEVVRERAARREETEAKRKKEEVRKPFNVPPRNTVSQLLLAPSADYVVAMVNEAGDRSKNTLVPNYVTESAYVEDINSRSNVGDTQGKNRLLLLKAETGAPTWVDTGIKDREIQLRMPLWSGDGSKMVVMARAADNKDRWILAVDPATGKSRILVTEHDDAWIDGPGANTLGWLKDDETIYFQSERDGYAHLYRIPYAGGEPKQLTSGKFEVSGVHLSHDGRTFYLTTSEAHFGEKNLYSMSVDGGPRTRITMAAGAHETTLSADEQWIADVHSYTNKPPELFVMPNRAGAEAKKLTSSPNPEFLEYPWIDVPIVEIPARDGAMVPARIYKPANFKKGGPAVMFVHGAGYLQNVHRYWSQYAPNYLFHHFLMEHGYMVIDIDYRGSAGYGRDWRTGIYRHMGGKDLDDHVDAAKWLVSQHGVDPKRIGLYGGSYGGFITLMALFTAPDVFAAGAALRPVTDWAHYNHGYTSNILNLPQKDAEAYRQSGPIYFAQNLKGALLICHGMVDTNVHFQDSVRLVQRLIELRKENWELAVYPVEDHGFVQPTSWADEYKRIFKLFESSLKK